MDSQLLTLSSIFTRDIYPFFAKGEKGSATAGRVGVVILAALGFAMAINPPSSILKIATHTFTGLAVLFPTVLFGLYLKQPKAVPAIASIIAGEATMLWFALAGPESMPVLPAMPVMLVTFSVYLGLQLFTGAPISWLWGQSATKWSASFALIFVMAWDFWQWDDRTPLFWGLPVWVWYFVALSALQILIMKQMTRSAKSSPVTADIINQPPEPIQSKNETSRGVDERRIDKLTGTVSIQ